MSETVLGLGASQLVPLAKKDSDPDLYLFLEEFTRKVDETVDFLLRPTFRSVSANYTAVDNDYHICGDATSGAFSITLMPASQAIGKVLVFKKVDASGNAVTVDGSGSETIDGSATYALSSQYDFVMIQSDGSNWHIISNN